MAALAAEFKLGGIGRIAFRANHLQFCPAFPAELHPFWVFRLALGTLHFQGLQWERDGYFYSGLGFLETTAAIRAKEAFVSRASKRTLDSSIMVRESSTALEWMIYISSPRLFSLKMTSDFL